MQKEVIFIFIISYLIGSISPGYILCRLIKGKDLRKLSPEYNTGAKNTYHNVGPFFGYITALIDFFKGFILMSFAYPYLINQELVVIAGLLTFVGHVFPFYLNFRGGTGVATLGGTTLFSIIYFDPLISIPKLMIFSAYSLTVSDTLRKKLRKFHIERKIYRLMAVLIPLIYISFGKNFVLKILIPLMILSLIIDIIRLKNERINDFLFRILHSFLKEKERNTASTTSLFLISTTLTIFLFTRKIAILAILFAIIGDLFAEIFGTLYGEHKIYKYKTLEGSFACFISCLISGLLFRDFTPIFTNLIVMGSLAATVTELLSVKVDDNLTMPIFTALILALI